MTFYLIAVDTVGIQPYLFGSNRLRENIGASEIVARVTERWVYETVANEQFAFQHNLDATTAPANQYSFNTKKIKEDKLDVEIIYAGGGNAVLIFADKNKAKQFAMGLTERVIAEAPGLNIVMAQQEFEWPDSPGEEKSLSQTYKSLMKALAHKKATRQPSAPLLGVSVTANCQSTGLPAVFIDHEANNRIVAADIWAKLEHRDAADERMEQLFEVKDRNYVFAKDFDQLGTKAEASYIAVVHADGNGISGRIDAIVAAYSSSTDNRKFIEQMQRFSELLKKVATNSIRRVINQLISAINPNDDYKIVRNGIELKLVKGDGPDKNRYILPLRPLVVGGDDITFVCDGRLGLTLTALYLNAFREEAKVIDSQDKDKELHACAGVAIVHNHYPFARAYDLSEALCSRAKSYARTQKLPDELGVSALDWHFAINGLLEDLSTIRQHEYTVNAGFLYHRPIRLTQPTRDPLASWQTLQSLMTSFQGEEWLDKRSKLKALFQMLRNGPEATSHFLQAYGLTEQMQRLPAVTADFQKNGWHNKRCGYFDALEAMDYFIDLETSPEQKL